VPFSTSRFEKSFRVGVVEFTTRDESSLFGFIAAVGVGTGPVLRDEGAFAQATTIRALAANTQGSRKGILVVMGDLGCVMFRNQTSVNE
jgi:hypothetical protein